MIPARDTRLYGLLDTTATSTITKITTKSHTKPTTTLKGKNHMCNELKNDNQDTWPMIQIYRLMDASLLNR